MSSWCGALTEVKRSKILMFFSPLFAAKNVLKQLMKVDPAHRITAKELLDNQWLTVSYDTPSFWQHSFDPVLESWNSQLVSSFDKLKRSSESWHVSEMGSCKWFRLSPQLLVCIYRHSNELCVSFVTEASCPVEQSWEMSYEVRCRVKQSGQVPDVKLCPLRRESLGKLGKHVSKCLHHLDWTV